MNCFKKILLGCMISFFIAVPLSSSIQASPLDNLPQDKLLHFSLSSVATSWLLKVQTLDGNMTKQKSMVAMAVVIGLGVFKEFADSRSGGRFDLQDIAADVAGAASGVALTFDF